MSYQPGTHIIATLQTNSATLIQEYSAIRSKLDDLIQQYSLSKLGEVYHNFTPSGFTAIICLSESHLSLHTWPEYNKVNIDIYLSNYLRSNDNTVHSLFHGLVAFLDAEVQDRNVLYR